MLAGLPQALRIFEADILLHPDQSEFRGPVRAGGLPQLVLPCLKQLHNNLQEFLKTLHHVFVIQLQFQ